MCDLKKQGGKNKRQGTDEITRESTLIQSSDQPYAVKFAPLQAAPCVRNGQIGYQSETELRQIQPIEYLLYVPQSVLVFHERDLL